MSKFEAKVCSRCGGSGNYSFNLMHGTMCYGCNGSGTQFTKRGLAALKFFEESLTVPASDLKVGMAIRESVGWKNFVTIQSIDTIFLDKDGEKQQVVQVDTGRCRASFHPCCRVRVMHTDEEKAVKLKAALEYQDSLNANGTVSKRKAKVK